MRQIDWLIVAAWSAGLVTACVVWVFAVIGFLTVVR
jgi:hypothetical protein